MIVLLSSKRWFEDNADRTCHVDEEGYDSLARVIPPHMARGPSVPEPEEG